MIRINLVGIPTHKSLHSFTVPPEVHSSTFPGFQIIGGDVAKASARVLEYLALAELRALDPWERDDLRVSWLTVLHCSEIQDYSYLTDNAHLYGKRVGEMIWEYGFWMYFGKTFDQALKLWAEKRAISEQALKVMSKKPSGSVPLPAERKRVA